MFRADRQVRDQLRVPPGRDHRPGPQGFLRGPRWLHPRGPAAPSAAHDADPASHPSIHRGSAMRRIAIAVATVLALSGCNRLSTEEFSRTQGTQAKAAAPAGDKYDIAKMDFKPPKAVVTDGVHSGPFAQG